MSARILGHAHTLLPCTSVAPRLRAQGKKEDAGVVPPLFERGRPADYFILIIQVVKG